jgi:hypothetical protein
MKNQWGKCRELFARAFETLDQTPVQSAVAEGSAKFN